MRPLYFTLLAGAAIAILALAQSKQTFAGVITDSGCPVPGDHALMKMGDTDAECTLACFYSHGTPFVLAVGDTIYRLSDQKKPEEFAGKKVTVIGTLDVKTKTIQMDSIAAAN